MRKITNYLTKYSSIFLLVFSIIIVSFFYIDLIKNNSFWSNYSFPWLKLIYTLGPLVLTGFAKLLAIQFKKKFNLVLAVLWLFSFFLILTVSKIDRIVPTLVFAIIYLCCLFFIGKESLSIFKIQKKSVVLAFLVGSVLFHHILFLLAAVSSLKPVIVYIVLSVSFVFFLVELYKKKQTVIVFFNSYFNRETDFTEKLFASYVVSILVLSLITISVPQTHADGVVERLPFLRQILEHATFPFHYYKWGLIMPLPLNLLLVPGYFFSGDLGASLTLFLYTIAFVLVIREFLNFLEVRNKLINASLCIILSLSPVWLITVTIYFDIAIALYCIGGLLVFLKSFERNSSKELSLAFFLWAFAVSIKMNAVIFIASILLIFFISNLGYVKLFLSNLLKISLVFMFAWIPWVIRSFLITGNPFFPFFTMLNNKDFSKISVLNSEATSAYFFDGGINRFVSIPWDLVFFTGKFGEYIPGTFNPLIFVLLLFCFQIFIILYSRKKISKIEIILILSSLLIIYLTSLALKASILRYWLGGFIVLLLVLAKVLQTYLDEFSEKYLRVFLFSFIPLSVSFNLLFGARINYGLPYGIGDTIWIGKPDSLSYIKNITFGIPNFINKRIDKGEVSFLTQFFLANHIHNPCIYISDFNSLFGVLTSLEKFSTYVNKYRVRYWVLNIQSPFEVDSKIKEYYLKEQAIVFASGDFAVYDLLGNQAEKNKSYFFKSSGTKELGWISLNTELISRISSQKPGWLWLDNVKDSGFLKVELKFQSNSSDAIFIGQIVGYDKNNIEIQRRLINKKTNIGDNKIIFYSDLSTEIVRLSVQVSPWTVKDGEFNIYETNIEFFK